MSRCRFALLPLLVAGGILFGSMTAEAFEYNPEEEPLAFIPKEAAAVLAESESDSETEESLPIEETEPVIVWHSEHSGYVVEYGRINVRAEASFDAMVVDMVCYGDELLLYEEVDDFTHVRLYEIVEENVYDYTGLMEDYESDRILLLDGYIYTPFLGEEAPTGAQVYLNVPLYKQGDPTWRWTKIGGYETLDSAGCTTTCISMVESYYTGETITPDIMVTRLNYDYDGYLTFPAGYERYSATNYLATALEFLHEGKPVLISLYAPWGTPHWVVIIGYTGNGIDLVPEDFLVNDPGRDNYTLAGTMSRYSIVSKLVVKLW